MEEHQELATECIEHDPKGYFIIKTSAGSRDIIVEHYDNGNILLNRIRGSNARYIYKRAIALGIVSDMSHAAYLGHELCAAQIAIENGMRYEQDKPVEFHQAHGDPRTEPGRANDANAGKDAPVPGGKPGESVKVGGVEMSFRDFLRSRGLGRAF